MYHDLIPPECYIDQIKIDLSKFTKQGDIYFFGWVLFELFIGFKIENYDINEVNKLINEIKKNENKEEEKLISIIYQCLDKVLFLFYFLFYSI